jgi:CheY-like chemotaxis protein
LARILIVDGDPASRESLERSLADEGLAFVSAADADAAWEAFGTFTPEAALIGRRLPRSEVEDLIFRLRRADPGLLLLGQGGSPSDLARSLRIRLGAPAPRAAAAPAPAGPGAERVLSRPAQERGEVVFGTLADVLARLWRGAADGILAVEHPGGAVDQVFLLRGSPVDVRLHADDRAPDVARALSALCSATRGAYRYHPGSDFSREVRADPTPALAPLLHGLRRSADEASFAESLAGLAGAVPRPGAVAAAVHRELRPEGADRALLEGMDGTRTVDALLREPGRPASLLWFLSRAGAIDLEPEAPAFAAGLATLEEPGPLSPP